MSSISVPNFDLLRISKMHLSETCMRLATVLTPESDENLRLAAQCGVTDMVTRYPGPTFDDLVAKQQRFRQFGLTLAAIEGYLPMEKIKLGLDDGRELDLMQELIRNMGRAGVPILCYNFMAGTDWVRTRLDAPERGGALVTGFDLAEAEHAVSLDHHVRQEIQPIHQDALWERLEGFLQAVLPVAEAANVTLAMHPDDPPLEQFLGRARIMNSVAGFQRLLEMHSSPANAICFCQGTFAEMGVDIPTTIRMFRDRIGYVHFRDVRGTATSFVETFHDNGPTDMAAAMRAYDEIGFRGPIRPDHTPQLEGEAAGEPGYTIKGRLFAWGYIRGLMHAIDTSSASA